MVTQVIKQMNVRFVGAVMQVECTDALCEGRDLENTSGLQQNPGNNNTFSPVEPKQSCMNEAKLSWY